MVLTAKGRISAYLFGMANTPGYAWLAYNNHLFGKMGLNLFFFVPTNIIGFLICKKNMAKNDNELAMRKLGGITTLLIFLLCAATNVLSIAATILTIFRFREQWLLYLVLNVFTALGEVDELTVLIYDTDVTWDRSGAQKRRV